MPRERVVLDTNVLISFALSPTATAAQAVERALALFDLLSSPATLAEFVTRLMQPKFDRYITLEQRRRLLLTVIQRSMLIQAAEQVTVCRDPDDNKFLELATSGQARFLITGDQDLLVLQAYGVTEIVTPARFLALTIQ
jgi:putative PIN family toxin of toxin-antitoxin system